MHWHFGRAMIPSPRSSSHSWSRLTWSCPWLLQLRASYSDLHVLGHPGTISVGRMVQNKLDDRHGIVVTLEVDTHRIDIN